MDNAELFAHLATKTAGYISWKKIHPLSAAGMQNELLQTHGHTGTFLHIH